MQALFPSLEGGESVQEHIKAMTETFNSLSVIGDTITDEDGVVYLLASLPESYNMLVTALEAMADVPAMEVVTERLLHEERKLKDRESFESREEAIYNKDGTIKQKVNKVGLIQGDGSSSECCWVDGAG